jgi:hypothetical protein
MRCTIRRSSTNAGAAATGQKTAETTRIVGRPAATGPASTIADTVYAQIRHPFTFVGLSARLCRRCATFE